MRLQRVIIIVFCVFCETSLLYAESASGFLKECNTGCLNTKFTFDSEQTACTLGCQKQAADIGRLGASGDSRLTCPKAKLEMDKGLMRVGYDEYKRLDNFYSRYCL